MASTDIVKLDGEGLTPEDVLAVARGRARVEVASPALIRVKRSRGIVDKLLQGDVPVYGLNTGFGSLRNVHIDTDRARELQRNLIRSHCCGVGEPASEDVVRAMILLRANTLAKGYSGVRPEVIDTLVRLLNDRICPVIPVRGSVGASGDLAPLSHLALVMMGEGEAFLPSGERVPAAQALLAAGIAPLELEAKEGLALNNGTQFMTAVGVLALLDAEYLAEVATYICALSVEALKGVPHAFDKRIHDVRQQAGQRESAAALRHLLAGSEILALPVNTACLNNAQEALERARDLLDAADGRWRGFASELNRLRHDLAMKLGSVANLIDKELARESGQLPPAGREDAESVRAAASRVFERHVLAAERLYEQAMAGGSGSIPAEARKHLCTAWEELRQAVPESVPVQDDYCLRCAPQVLGAARDAFRHVREVLGRELNAATDNPLIFPPERDDGDAADLAGYLDSLSPMDCKRAVVSGGNFHGAPVAAVLDYACIALASVGNISERRTFHLTTGRLSNGLPRLLTRQAGLRCGLMIAQVTAASLVSENKTLCHPASVDSIPTVEDAEDHVSMGAWAARKFAEVGRNVRWVVAIEYLAALRGLSFRQPLRPVSVNGATLGSWLADKLPELQSDGDRPLTAEIEAVAQAIQNRDFVLSF